jgi:hypothetical protein
MTYCATFRRNDLSKPQRPIELERASPNAIGVELAGIQPNRDLVLDELLVAVVWAPGAWIVLISGDTGRSSAKPARFVSVAGNGGS